MLTVGIVVVLFGLMKPGAATGAGIQRNMGLDLLAGVRRLSAHPPRRGWQGRRPALVAVVGLVVIAVCYIGVNLLGIGLHSYGWFF